MVRSALWDAQDALFALLKADAGLARVPLSLGRQTSDQDEGMWVSGEVNQWSQSYQVSGVGAKDEAFTLQVSILVTRLGGEYVKARNRARDLGRIVEDVVSANHTLSGSVMLAQVSGGRVSESMVDERHRAVMLVIDIDCQAWIP